MQISEAWLREYVNPPISTDELVAQLTMAGLEVDSVTPAAAQFSGVVIGEVLAMEQHPDADRLRVCQVAVGAAEPLQIVCGAANVRVGLKIPAALCGAVLPGDFKIKKSKLRGVESLGMLCSEKELGLVAEAHGLMELPADAPVGTDIRDYLQLNDMLIEVDLTPNRADCLSVQGIAREVAVLNQINWQAEAVSPPTVRHDQTLAVNVLAPDACPRYLGRLITGVNVSAETPLWMQERLRRSGVRSLGPVVDVTNYVLLELGQPLHAFDADKLQGGISVRWAVADEELALLNGQTIKLDAEALVIADDQQALALAGVMGGSGSAVSDATQNIFLECAFFAPYSIAGKARRFGLHTDSSHRFERGVDATLQERAIARATRLIIDIAGGSVGEITEATASQFLPQRPAIWVRRQRVAKILGMVPDDATVNGIFQRLGMVVENVPDGWQVTPPGCRFDIAIEVDLIEEIARIYGYNQLPSTSLLMRAELGKATESVLDISRVADLLVDRGYQEAITYSFVDEEIQATVAPDDEVIRLKNPISSELAIMRTSLWCGLLKAALYNTNRQQNRVRFFETGLRFVKKDGVTHQESRLAGLALGSVLPEQWGEKSRKADFFDMKADVEAIFALTERDVRFTVAEHTALHPGQSAKIESLAGETIGWLGMLHPSLEKQLGFDTQVFLFDLDQQLLLDKRVSSFKPLSKFPSMRRDLALIVKEEISADDVVDCIKDSDEPTLQHVVIFDIYRGKGVDDGSKSIALSLYLQNDLQTLTDSEVDAVVARILAKLTNQTNAKLRD
ncbi:MAG: phenylalanine--tRNA ligase subunit beta [Methylovulum sp.]|uniref:phenylalanine--tRNA ligase subunit beta n=1 Tax=Methylovulum sp. TaxID=1916980 RepID=UPI00262BB9AC|nr:phenylalanine--tRNA ligase subunit beta [Methylovulum sp.]MDD2723447.1 phenylalanine--tRNA ligase subunit beta [Methylovulum sp.]MDD5124084.1 phenylalanine--tRNA ligase subunit beta [Methylovulum sp.]